MRLLRGLIHLEPLEQGCVLTIGNFDGVHLGHRVVIEKLAEQGKLLNLPVVVLCFEPQPLEYFLAENAPSRLTRLREKVIQFMKLPIDNLLIVPFNRQFANYDAEAFIEKILANTLKVKYLVIGDDFHFGKARRGNFAMLREKGRVFGFKVENTQSFQIQGVRVSSTLIRDALAEDDLTLAADLLGRAYSICGRVVRGKQLGRTLGFPTANIRLFRKNTPINGVFAVTVSGIAEKVHYGVANVGTRPTVDGSAKVILEVHLFDFATEIYGQYVEVHFQHKIRNEQCFESLAELKAQIEADVMQARAFFEIF